ncbi:MAG: SRPBCC family protein [Pseudomonadota bacterium]
MQITQSFKVARPLPAVWALFQDIPEIARCMPGAELIEDKGDGNYLGRVGIKLGPFNASFEGEAKVKPDAATHTGHVEGKGMDKRGGSRSKLVMDYALSEAGGLTAVDIKADLQLSGPVAQFGRTGVITETANVLIAQFARNIEQKLAPAETVAPPAAEAKAVNEARPAPTPANQISVASLISALVASFFRRLFGRA